METCFLFSEKGKVLAGYDAGSLLAMSSKKTAVSAKLHPFAQRIKSQTDTAVLLYLLQVIIYCR